MTGSEFRDHRNALGLTQRELAERMQVKRETVNRWERAKRPVPEIAALAIRQIMAESGRRKRST